MCPCLCGCVGNNKSQGKGGYQFQCQGARKELDEEGQGAPEGGVYKKGKLGDSILIENV